MFKSILLRLVVATAAATGAMSAAFAAADVNKADQVALTAIKGIGPKISKAILDERKKGGDFKGWDDFQRRVKGIGESNSQRMSDAGLTINGLPKVKDCHTGDKKK